MEPFYEEHPENSTLVAFDLTSLMYGIKEAYSKGFAIGDPEETYKAGNRYVVEINYNPEKGEFRQKLSDLIFIKPRPVGRPPKNKEAE